MAHSMIPGHERLPARMRVRLMRIQRAAGVDVVDVEGGGDMVCVDGGGGRRVRFLEGEKGDGKRSGLQGQMNLGRG